MTSNFSNTPCDSSDSLIRIKKKRITSEKYIPTQVCFELTNKDLNLLKSQRNRLVKLNFSSELLADLRYYSLLQNPESLESRLIFTTYYIKQQQKIAVIKTIIDLRGTISQQISRSFLHHPQLVKELVTTHYWLIGQISDRLFFKYTSKTSFLAWILSLVILLILTPFLLYLFKVSLLIKLILLGIIFLLLYLAIHFLSKRYLAGFILRQLLFGFLSRNVAKRHFGFMLLRYFA